MRFHEDTGGGMTDPYAPSVDPTGGMATEGGDVKGQSESNQEPQGGTD